VDSIIESIKDDEEYKGKSTVELRKIADEQYWASQIYTRQELLEVYEQNKGVEKFLESLSKYVTVTDSEVVSRYDTLKSEQKSKYQTNFSAYESDMNSNAIVTFHLPGYKKVQSILIQIPDKKREEIAEERDNKNDEKADELRDEALKEIEAKAREALDKALNSNMTFEALIVMYNDDPGMDDEETRKAGYLVGPQTTRWAEEYKNAALKLKEVGDITTELVKSDYGYFIIKLIENVPNGEVKYEDLNEKIREELLSEKKANAQEKAVQELYEKAKIKRYRSRLKIYDYAAA